MIQHHPGNLVKNPRLLPWVDHVPEHFAVTGPFTYDNFSIKRHHTMSLTIKAGETAKICYKPILAITGEKILDIGLEIRAIESGRVCYEVEFLSAAKEHLTTKRLNLTDQISYYFSRVQGQFHIPPNACYAKIGLEFTGPITALTFWAPYAYHI